MKRSSEKYRADALPPASHTTPAIPTSANATAYSDSTARRARLNHAAPSSEIPSETLSAVSTATPCCHDSASEPGETNCHIATVMSAVDTITTTPGSHATTPIANATEGPHVRRAHAYTDPCTGNIRPSWAATSAHGARKHSSPSAQNVKAAGPAPCSSDACTMNRTAATNTSARSTVPSVRLNGVRVTSELLGERPRRRRSGTRTRGRGRAAGRRAALRSPSRRARTPA